MRSVVLSALAAALLAGCATTPVTTLEVTWAAPQLAAAASFKKLLIISVAGDEFIQIAFQDQMAARLKARGVNAVASHRYFTRYTTAEKARFKQSIDDSDADFVLVARVTTTKDTITENRGTIIGANGLPYADANDVSGTFARFTGDYVAGGDYSEKTVTAEASIFAKKEQKLIWSARTRTTNAGKRIGADSAPQYIEVILEAMKKDKLL